MEGVATYRAILVMAQGVTSMQHATPPLALTDDQLATVLRAAEPLPPRDRTAFFAAVAQVLAGQAVLGDGIVGRTCSELRRRFMTSPPKVPRHEPRCRAVAPMASERAPKADVESSSGRAKFHRCPAGKITSR
jgi:hypothetical protein